MKNSIKKIFTFIILICLNGCILTPKTYNNKVRYKDLINKKFILIKDMSIWRETNKESASKKEPKYFLMSLKNIPKPIEKYKDAKLGIILKGTEIQYIGEYSYYKNYFANGISFNVAEILTGDYKGFIVKPYGIFYDKDDKIKINATYAIEVKE